MFVQLAYTCGPKPTPQFVWKNTKWLPKIQWLFSSNAPRLKTNTHTHKRKNSSRASLGPNADTTGKHKQRKASPPLTTSRLNAARLSPSAMRPRPWRKPSHVRTRVQNDRIVAPAVTLHQCLYTSTLMRFHAHPQLPCNSPQQLQELANMPQTQTLG